MTDTNTQAAPAETNENILAVALQDGDNLSVSVDLARIPPAARRELLVTAVRSLINGRPHSAAMRFKKENDEYKAKCEADPTFDGTAPTAPNLSEIAEQAIADLYEGKIRQRNRGGAKKPQEAKDPVDAVVTQAVIRELYAKRKAEAPGTKYQEVVKEIAEAGGGIAFLRARIETIAGGDEKKAAELTKGMEKKYIAPARLMVSQNAKGEQQENELL